MAEPGQLTCQRQSRHLRHAATRLPVTQRLRTSPRPSATCHVLPVLLPRPFVSRRPTSDVPCLVIPAPRQPMSPRPVRHVISPQFAPARQPMSGLPAPTTTCLTLSPHLSTTCPVPSCRPYATIHSRARRPHPDESSLLSTARLRRPMSGRVCATPPDDSGRARSSRITPTCQPRPDMPFRTIPIHIHKGVTQ